MSLQTPVDDALRSLLQSSYNGTFRLVYDQLSRSLDSKTDAFQFCLQCLYPMLQDLESGEPVTDRKILTSAVTHGEFLLWRLHDVDVKVHPFLSHWVETVLRLQERLSSGGRGDDKEANFAWAMAMKTRLEVIRCVLSGDGEALQAETPQALLEKAMKGRPVDVKEATEWLYETGVWDRPASTSLPAPEVDIANPYSATGARLNVSWPDIRNNGASGKAKAPEIPATPPDPPGKASKADEQLKDLQNAFAIDPTSTLLDLRHLPISISNLESINLFLTSTIPVEYGIDTAGFSREYVQHCLRSMETLSTTREDPFQDAPTERDEISRLVRLLLLFMRNLLDKSIASYQALEWEFREIFVRYVWVPEVREMRELFGVGEQGWWQDESTTATGVGG